MVTNTLNNETLFSKGKPETHYFKMYVLPLSKRFLVRIAVVSLLEWFATVLPNKGQTIHPERRG